MRVPLLLAALFAGVSAMPAAAQQQPAPAALPGEGAEDARLKALFHASDEASLKRNPLNALFRGDLRYADQLGNYYTDAYLTAELAASDADLAALRKIDRAKLTSVNKIAYDVFEADQLRAQKGFRPEILSVSKYLPMDHFTGFQAFY
ncbi:MAG: DUF885 domain-containing protein, partial [Sphingomonadales bacterium]